MKTILLADDEKCVLDALNIELTLTGRVKVQSTRFGKEVMPMLNGGFHPDLVILDVYIDSDKQDGEQILEQRKSHPDQKIREIPVLILTGKIDPAEPHAKENPSKGIFYMIKTAPLTVTQKLLQIFPQGL
jgi:DNA-binding NtrC family response regulator